ncbi:hypothetical protein BO70DRAFT_53411 [Aspergillus heteromorphus CBS 117.55]|uniref:Uncharacterized protein n=1 Tax=Aspergillus heteromorphus CBS 117.55 TaxID=1448321 RepID=A0A317VZB8_9EURO|nr:uncharacterized protein BO70DRAFT_53411 [Aspergillus heteromorphus CBS 117.55]PWY79684.1 hypothetical protein BO70DRAFT_53411 [Aspergillus heteromorphus CBS 117.55]
MLFWIPIPFSLPPTCLLSTYLHTYIHTYSLTPLYASCNCRLRVLAWTGMLKIQKSKTAAGPEHGVGGGGVVVVLVWFATEAPSRAAGSSWLGEVR